MAIRLIIQGLRRSGTTIFWRTLRQDGRFTCFDEPFSPQIQYLPSRRKIYNPGEFEALLRRDGVAFWERFSPIDSNEELRGGFSDLQRAWLEFVGDEGERVMFDTTRCQFKVADLHRIAPGAVFVHLWRSPAAQATSHLLPARRGRFAGLLNLRDRHDFFTRRDRYNGWSFERIIGDSPLSLFAFRLREAGIDPDEVYALPAAGRLMAYWHLCWNRVERDGRRHYGDRFVSVRFESFCADPASALGPVYAALGMEMPKLDLSAIHPAKPPHRADAPEWRRLAPWSELPAAAR